MKIFRKPNEESKSWTMKAAVQKETHGGGKRSKAGKKKSKKPGVDMTKSIDIKLRNNGKSETEGQDSQVGKTNPRVTSDDALILGPKPIAWKSEGSVAETLFGHVEPTVNDEEREQEMIEEALVESLKTAMLEKCVLETISHDEPTHEVSYGSEDDSWGKVTRNLPDPEPEKDCKFSVANDDSEVQHIAKNPTVPDSQSVGPLIDDVHSTKQPIFDAYGRIGGLTECHMFMGKGARRKEQEFIRQQQLQSQLKNNVPSDATQITIQTSARQTQINKPESQTSSRPLDQPSKQLTEVSETSLAISQNREPSEKHSTSETNRTPSSIQHSTGPPQPSTIVTRKPNEHSQEHVRFDEQSTNSSNEVRDYFDGNYDSQRRQDVKYVEPTPSTSHQQSSRPTRPILSGTNSNSNHQKRSYPTNGQSVNRGYYVDDKNFNRSNCDNRGNGNSRSDQNNRNDRDHSRRDQSRDSNVNRYSNKPYDDFNRSGCHREKFDNNAYHWVANKNQMSQSTFGFGRGYGDHNSGQNRVFHGQTKIQQNINHNSSSSSNEKFVKIDENKDERIVEPNEIVSQLPYAGSIIRDSPTSSGPSSRSIDNAVEERQRNTEKVMQNETEKFLTNPTIPVNVEPTKHSEVTDSHTTNTTNTTNPQPQDNSINPPDYRSLKPSSSSSCVNCDLVAPLEVRHARLRLHDPLLYNLLVHKQLRDNYSPPIDVPVVVNSDAIPTNEDTFVINENLDYDCESSTDSVTTVELSTEAHLMEPQVLYQTCLESNRSSSTVHEAWLYHQDTNSNSENNNDRFSNDLRTMFFGNSSVPGCNVASIGGLENFSPNDTNRNHQYAIVKKQHRDHETFVRQNCSTVHRQMVFQNPYGFPPPQHCHVEHERSTMMDQIVPHVGPISLPFVHNEYQPQVNAKRHGWVNRGNGRGMLSPGAAEFVPFLNVSRGRATRPRHN